AISALPDFDKGKSINPQWSQDGKSVYFVSDRTGISNLYRLDIESHGLFQLTDLVTGVSGITGLSPALRVASQANPLAHSAYVEGRYEIYAIDGADQLAGWPAAAEERRTAALIPGAKAGGAVMEAQAEPAAGLAEPETFRKEPYKPKLGLDY